MGFQQSTRGLVPAIAALLAGCVALHLSAAEPVPMEASEMLARVRALERGGEDPTGVERRDLLEQAIRLAPDWVSPVRLQDELDLTKLRGPVVLARRRAALEAAGDPLARARASYLLGRLGGDERHGLMSDSVRYDQAFAWGHHGLAWGASERGDVSEAILHERRAISLARDSFDRTLFTLSLAHYLRSEEREEDAYTILVALSEELVLSESDSVWWAAERAAFGLQLEEAEVVEESWRALLVVLADPLLGEDGAVRLTQRARVARREIRGLDPGGLRLDAALAARPEDEDKVLFQRARLAHECGRFVRAAALWDRVAKGELRAPTRERRVAGFAAGRFREAVKQWLEGLPALATDDGGLPKSEALAHVVATVRQAAPGRAKALRELGDACLKAGWFAEAAAIAPHLAAVDTEGALSLSVRADRGFTLLEFFDRSLGKDLQPIPEPGAEERANWLGIERFLSALGREIDGARELFGEEEAASLRDSISQSPLYVFSPFAALVHPGPVMSRQDQRLGVGRAGDLVEGLAELGHALGRFILLGQLAGRDRADGAVFPVLWEEHEHGEHLGVKWSGSVVWCEGIEPVGWLGRNSGVTGAALHDGYWVDIEAVRRQHERWLAFQREWPLEASDAVLAIPVPPAGTGAERRALLPTLGAGARVQLAVMSDRGGEVPSFTEFLSVVAIHEEGHLVDRALHLPLSSHPLRTVRLLGRAAFDPSAVLERLEYRAQAVALCDVEDPRLVLADCLLMVESSPPIARSHVRGYQALLEDLLAILDQRVQEDPAAWPEIDKDGMLVHQLYRLGPEEVRSLGQTLARRLGIP